MKKTFFVHFFLVFITSSFAQNASARIENAYKQFEADSQLRHAISSLYVINAKTGDVVFDKNSQIGLAPASTQKIITATTAFELLGRNYGYKTLFFLNGKIKKDTLNGDLIIKGSGDPTFGSPRFSNTKRKMVLDAISNIMVLQKIKFITGDIIIDESSFETNTIPDGWIWQDIGNYYGAGASALNWNENQYDLVLKSGEKENDDVEIKRTEPELQVHALINELKTGPKNSGDNGYIYIAPYTVNGFVRGTIPPGKSEFTISGSFPMPSVQFLYELQQQFEASGLKFGGRTKTSLDYKANKEVLKYAPDAFNFIVSPSLDSIIYWFLQKSINLYGEALIKTLAYEKKGFGSTDTGVLIVKDFWKQKGLDVEELNIMDGSGLSPQNRVTTHAQVEILKYAKTKEWFPYFYAALPTYNGMKMKSGSITDVKGYCGYQKSSDGNEYIFSFLVNNYNGRSSTVVNKMYKVVDVLK